MYISHKFFNIFFVVFLVFALFFSANTIHAITLLEDDFTGTTINQTKWTMVGGSEGVDYIQNGNMNVRNSGVGSGFSPGNARVLKSASNFSKANDLTISANITNTTGAWFLGYGDFSGGNYYFVRSQGTGRYIIGINKNGAYYTINPTNSCPFHYNGAKLTIKIVSNYFDLYVNDVFGCTLSGSVDGTAPVMTSHPVFLQGSTTGSFFDNVLVTNSEVGPPPSTVPDAISNLAASEWGNTTTNLTWTAPSNGGDAITDYAVDYRVSGDVAWTNFLDGVSASTGATVTGLTNGVTYQFRVRAVNGVGTALDSNIPSVTVLAPTVPGAPTGASATGVTGDLGQIIVSFTAPVSNGGSAITSYTVTSSPGGFTQNIASSPVTFSGLTDNQSYTFTVTATNGIGTSSPSAASNSATPLPYPSGVSGSSASWTRQHNSGARNWTDIASSDDGVKLVAVHSSGYIYTSSDSGVTWTERTNSGYRVWSSVASSSDGVKLVATRLNGYIYTSTDSGATWTERATNIGDKAWSSVSSSANGVKLVATVTGTSDVYTSNDSGVNWSLAFITPRDFKSSAITPDGTKQIAGTFGNKIYYNSTGTGGNWYQYASAPSVSDHLAISADGLKIISLASSGTVATSSDGGTSWTIQVGAPSLNWTGVESSSDGNRIIASSSSGVYTSSDAGVNWRQETTSALWSSVAGSSDGSKIFATVNGGYIYTGILDVTPPTITNVSSDKANGTYTTGEVIDIDVTFSEAVTSTGNVTVTLETGTTDRTCTFTVTNSTTGTCNYTVVAGDETSDLTVKTISGTINDQHLNAMTDFVPVTNLAANKALVIDTTAPTIIEFGATPSNTTAIVTWETNENSSSIVDYGVTNSYETSTVESDTSPRVTSHTVNLSSLVPCTTYFFQVRSRDAALNSVVNQSVFTTLGCVGDASIVSSTLGLILDSTGGTKELVTGVDKSINLSIPAGTVSDDASFQIKQLDQAPALLVTGTPSGAIASSSHVYDLKALTDANTAITSFNDQITITLNYLDEDVVGIVESSLLIYRWDGVTWNPLSGCVVDTTLNTITCTTTNFSVFSLFGTPIPSPSSSVTNGAVNVAFLQELSDRLRKESSNNNITPVKKEEKKTEKKCGILPDNPKVLKLNSKHPSAKTLQQILNCKGYTISVSGVGSPGRETTLFGLKTRAQILKFQKDNNLKTDGIAGPQFRKLINKQ